jgi:hypothetical protein
VHRQEHCVPRALSCVRTFSKGMKRIEAGRRPVKALLLSRSVETRLRAAKASGIVPGSGEEKGQGEKESVSDEGVDVTRRDSCFPVVPFSSDLELRRVTAWCECE